MSIKNSSYGKEETSDRLDELAVPAYLIDMVVSNIVNTVTGSIVGQFLGRWVTPNIEKIRFKSWFSKSLHREVSAAISDAASAEGMSDEFIKRRARVIAKNVTQNKTVRDTLRAEFKNLKSGAPTKGMKKVTAAVAKEGAKEMKKQWSKENMNETMVPTNPMPLLMPASAQRILTPWAIDDFETGSQSVTSPVNHQMSQAGVSRSFADGSNASLVSIEDKGRRLEINPATRDAYVWQGGRRVHLGIIDTWTTPGIKRMIQRYLGVVSDAAVVRALRDLDLMEDNTKGSEVVSYLPVRSTMVKP